MDGEKLKYWRYARGHTLRELADRADVAFYTIWSIEQGRTQRPHPATLQKLAAALEIDPRELMPDGPETGKAAA